MKIEEQAVRASLTFRQKMWLAFAGGVVAGAYWLLDPPWWLNLILASITIAEYTQNIILQIVIHYRARNAYSQN